MPNKKKTSCTRGRGKGKKMPSSCSSKGDDPIVHVPADRHEPPADDALEATGDIPETPLNDESCVPENSRSINLPREGSCESSMSSHESNDVSKSSCLADSTGKKTKRGKKTSCNLSIAEEELMLEFIMDNPVLWNVKMTDYRRKDKKDKIWEDQAQQMQKTAETLKGWFRSLRDTHTRLDKKKSGDSAPNLTEREQWIMSKFAFLKTITRHRPEPMQSLKATIQRHRKDLNAAESACADVQIDLDEITSIPPSSRKRPRDPDRDVIESLQNRVAESGAILENLSKAKQQPTTPRMAFANYVKDSLVTMSMSKYKRARSTINKILSEMMDEESDDDIPSGLEALPIKSTQQASTSQPPHPPRPNAAPPFWPFSPSALSFSRHYQKSPHVSMNVPQASSVWGSQSVDYMDQVPHQLLEHTHHHVPPTSLQQIMPSPQLLQQPIYQIQPQQQHCTPTSTPVCESFGSAAQVLKETPGTTQHNAGASVFQNSIRNISTLPPTLSGFRDIMGSPDDIRSQDEVLNTQPQI